MEFVMLLPVIVSGAALAFVIGLMLWDMLPDRPALGLQKKTARRFATRPVPAAMRRPVLGA